MKPATILASISAVFAVIAACTGNWIVGVFPHPQTVIVFFLYWPVAFVTFAVFLVSLVKSMKDRQWLLPLFLCIPMLAYVSYEPSYAISKWSAPDEVRRSRDGDTSILLRRHLLWYYELHHERFRTIGADDEVIPEGFTEFISKMKNAGIPPGWTIRWKISDGQILDPWGKPYKYYLDVDRDGFIIGCGRRNSVNGYAEPWSQEDFFYTTGVGVSSSKQDFVETWTDFEEWIRKDDKWRSFF
jgi:hypothetical protein